MLELLKKNAVRIVAAVLMLACWFAADVLPVEKYRYTHDGILVIGGYLFGWLGFSRPGQTKAT